MTTRRRKADLFVSGGQSLALVPTVPEAYGATVAAARSGAVHRIGATSGLSIAERLPTIGRKVDDLAAGVSGNRWLLDSSGTSDVSDTAGLTAGQVIDAMEDYWAARQAAGFLVIATTVPSNTNYDGAEETKRLTVNNSIRASTVVDGVVDLATITTGGLDFENYSSGTFYDGIHWIAAAATAVGLAFLAEVAAIEATL